MSRDTAIACVILLVFFTTARSHAHEPNSRLSLSALKNMTYSSEWTQSKNARLIDGAYSEQAAPGSATRTREITQRYALRGNRLVLLSSRNGEPEARLSGTRWRWGKFRRSDGETIDVDQPENYTIAFLPEGKVSVRADCNRGSGTYRVMGDELSISIMVLTRAACPPESLSDHYVRNLNDVASYVLEGDKLDLNLKMDGGSMVFFEGN
jgi:heat shock protein HslJ